MKSTNIPPHYLRPAWMEVDLDRLSRNIGEVRRVIGRDCLLIAVAKGDAYGLGVLTIVPSMFKYGADMVALGNLNDAIRLREAGCDGQLIIFGSYLPKDVAEIMVKYKIIPSVWDVEGAEVFSRVANQPFEVYLKIDTGLHRLGIHYENAAVVAKEIHHLPNIVIGGVYTHIADPVNDHEFTNEQYLRFLNAVEAIRREGVQVSRAAVASSAIVSMFPEMYINAVDPGRLLYGIKYPTSAPVKLDILPVMRALKSRIIQTKWIEAGNTIGYDRSFYAHRRTLVGVIAIGWWDGLPRDLASRTNVLVRGKYCPIIASMHLEHSLVDLTNVEKVKAGDEAVIFGEQDGAFISLAEQAEIAGLSELELMIRIGRTIPRVYIENGRVINC